MENISWKVENSLWNCDDGKGARKTKKCHIREYNIKI
jgi:hypothetical protein